MFLQDQIPVGANEEVQPSSKTNTPIDCGTNFNISNIPSREHNYVYTDSEERHIKHHQNNIGTQTDCDSSLFDGMSIAYEQLQNKDQLRRELFLEKVLES